MAPETSTRLHQPRYPSREGGLGLLGLALACAVVWGAAISMLRSAWMPEYRQPQRIVKVREVQRHGRLQIEIQTTQGKRYVLTPANASGARLGGLLCTEGTKIRICD